MAVRQETESPKTRPVHVGVGLYTFPEAARILSVKPAKLRRWAEGYRVGVRGVEHVARPVIPRYFADGQRMLTFLELIELLFVKLFRGEGVTVQVIRKAAEEAARRFDTPYPFAVKRFDTDGRRIFATLEAEAREARFIEELGKGQLVFDEVARPFFRKIEYRGGGDALRYWPMGGEGRVVLDSRRSFGKPIDAETGVPTRALYDAVLASGGQAPETVAHWFAVPLEAVQAAAAF